MNEQTRLQASQILSKYKVCDACLGRFFKREFIQGSNEQKGEALRQELQWKTKIPVSECWLCEGLLEEIDHFADLITESLAGYEYKTFLVGSKIDETLQKREEQVWAELGGEDHEPIKMEVNREVGKILEPRLGKTVDILNPEIMAVIDTVFDVVHLQISPLFLYGRYQKFQRGIPQTKWPCSVCRGKGCKRCGYSGKLYPTSVEELVAGPVLEASRGAGESFHGSGREDIDALMLGTGRPFVLEVKNPQIRAVDLQRLQQLINERTKGVIEVSMLRFSSRDEIARIKEAEFKKTYRVTIEAEVPLNKEKLIKVAQTLQGKLIQQLTPTRVAHRRANKVRERTIYTCAIESVEGTRATFTIETESGTYVKEFVSGDDERTKPNLSELIGIPCRVAELDVIDVKGE